MKIKWLLINDENVHNCIMNTLNNTIKMILYVSFSFY